MKELPQSFICICQGNRWWFCNCFISAANFLKYARIRGKSRCIPAAVVPLQLTQAFSHSVVIMSFLKQCVGHWTASTLNDTSLYLYVQNHPTEVASCQTAKCCQSLQCLSLTDQEKVIQMFALTQLS